MRWMRLRRQSTAWPSQEATRAWCILEVGPREAEAGGYPRRVKKGLAGDDPEHDAAHNN
jgi:hypothetical protein